MIIIVNILVKMVWLILTLVLFVLPCKLLENNIHYILIYTIIFSIPYLVFLLKGFLFINNKIN